MSAVFFELFSIRPMPTGRRLFALRSVLRHAQELGHDDVVRTAVHAIEENRELLRQEQRFARHGGDGGGRGGRQGQIESLSGHLARTLSAIYGLCEGTAEGLGPEEERAQMARRVLRRAFPAGVGALTMGSFDAELVAVLRLLELFEGDLAEEAEVLGLWPFLHRLAELATSFDAEIRLSQSSTSEVWTAEQLRDRRRSGQLAMLQVVVEVCGLSTRAAAGVPAGERDEELNRLLGPILFQSHTMEEYARRKKRPHDVNPETGEVDEEAVVALPEMMD